MPVVDLATLAFEIDGGRAEAGARRVNAALDAIERKAAAALQAIARFNQGLGSRVGAGAGGALSRVEQAAVRHQQKLEQIAARGAENRLSIEVRAAAQLQAIQARRDAAAERSAQRLSAINSRSAASFSAVNAAASRIVGTLTGLAAGVGVVALLRSLGQTALQSAIDIDRQVNVLKAFTGSAEAAEKRLASLIATAEKTPGLTTTLAATLDTQLRVAGAAERTIDRLLPAIGKLNAVSPLQDPQRFVQNLVQLVTQNFEKIDLKELVGQSPLAGELIKEVFKVDSPINAEAIRKSADQLGIRTIDAFAEALAKAGDKNPVLANIAESLGSRIGKAKDKILVALAPLGNQLGKILLPILDDVVAAVRRFAPVAEKAFRDSKDDIVEMTRQVGNLILEIGRMGSSLGGFETLRDLVREIALDIADARDFLSGDLSLKNILTFGILGEAGPRVKALNQRFGRIDDRLRLDAINQADRSANILNTATGFLPDPSKINTATGTLPDVSLLPNARRAGGGGGAGRAGATALEREARAIRQAQLELEKSASEQVVRLLKAEREERLAILKEEYDQGLIATRKFYDEKVKIAADNIAAELSLLVIERRGLEESRGSAKGAEKIRIEQRIGEVITEQQLKVIELTKAFRENFSEFKKLTVLPLFDPDQTQLKVEPVVPPIILRARERLRELRAGEEQFDRLQANLESRVQTGALDEVAGRKQLLAVEREYREQLISTAEARLELAIIEKGANSAAAAQIEAEIEGLKSLGQELTNTQRFLRGLGSGPDSGRLFEDLGSGLRNAIRDGFTDGFAGARRGFTDLLKNLAADFLTSQLIQLLRNIFNPRATSGAAQTATAAATGGGSFSLGGILGGLGIGGGQGGGGIFTTPPIAGGSIPGIGGGGPGLGGLNIGGLLGKIPGLGRIFGGGGGAGSKIPGLILEGDTGAGGTFGSVPLGGAQPGLLGSLGGFGLLAGGGLLGGLLGGSSPTGRILGNVGGSLLAGFAGASGLFGGGIAGALPALFSNPITAIIGGAILGGLALSKLFGGGTFKKFQQAVESQYQVKVKGDQPGKALFQQVESLGKAAFGSFSKNISRTVQLEEARDLIGQYAESTNQEGAALVKRMRQIRDIGEIGNPANQFVRRRFGGDLLAGQLGLIGEGGPEFVRFPLGAQIMPANSPGVVEIIRGVVREVMRSQPQPPRRGAQDQMMAAMFGALMERLDRIDAVPPEYVFIKGGERGRSEVGRIVREGLAASPSEQRELSLQLGLG